MKQIFSTLVTFFTQSSEDPAKTSATLTGILIMIASDVQQYLGFIPGVHDFYASQIGMSLTPIATDVGMIIGGAWALFGLFRKLTNKVESTSGLRVE